LGITDEAKYNADFMAYGRGWNVEFLRLLTGHSDDDVSTLCISEDLYMRSESARTLVRL
jgi:hypothetical protein